MFASRTQTTRSLFVTVILALLVPTAGYAHPMGNFSVNHYSRISIRPDSIEVLYLLDLAEIPAYQEIQQAEIATREDDAGVKAYLLEKGRMLGGSLVLQVDGQKLPFKLVSQHIIFPPGAGGLPTIKMGFVYRAEVRLVKSNATAHVRYVDLNFPGRAGWKEIVIDAPAEAVASSSAPRTDRSQRLSNYPTDLLKSPPQDLEANITFRPSVLLASTPEPTGLRSQATAISKEKVGRAVNKEAGVVSREPSPFGEAKLTAKSETKGLSKKDAIDTNAAGGPVSAQRVDLQPNSQTTPRSSFTELIQARNLSFWFLFVAAGVAAGFGALHALEPGHGKTIVAAFLVGSRGTAQHAFLLGVIVTISHTAGVYLLGAVTLYAQKYILPERIYPFLGVLSGILIAGTGCYLLLQRHLGAEFAHTHDYKVSTGNKTSEGATLGKGKSLTSELFLLGFTGGMVPCPGALVVLLSAVAMHRPGLGLFLIVAFSVGLAAVLISMGLAAVYAGRLLSRVRFEGPLVSRWLPMASAATITVLGFGITWRGLLSAGMVHLR